MELRWGEREEEEEGGEDWKSNHPATPTDFRPRVVLRKEKQ